METRDVENLKKWFVSQKRDLPWRDQPSSYAVWVSEVMLQQTQVAVVIAYFQRWMSRFPTIKDLAKAPLEDVIKEWEGLGYYSRARNLHEGARYVVEHHKGVLPSTAEELKKIKGLGDYTVGAILSFAFHQRTAAVDGNVLRVLSRYYGLADDICKAKTVKKFQELAQKLLPKKEPWIISEGLIELGATVCSRNPKCFECPLKTNCQAFAQDKTQELPVKTAKSVTQSLFRTVAIVVCNGHILVSQGEKGKIMADLFEFPYCEMSHAETEVTKQLHLIKQKIDLPLKWQQTLPPVKHSFTNFRALLIPQLIHTKVLKEIPSFQWHSLEALKKLPFSSGHRRILSHLLSLHQKNELGFSILS